MKLPKTLCLDGYNQRIAGFNSKEEALDYIDQLDKNGITLWYIGSKEKILSENDLKDALGYDPNTGLFPNYLERNPNKSEFTFTIEDPSKALSTAINKLGEFSIYAIYGKVHG